METKMSSHGTGLPLLSSNNSVSALSRHPILAMAFHVLRFVGGHVPLRQLGEHVDDPPLPVVVLTPARELSASDHVRAGAAIAAAAARSPRRVAFIASADHGHAHLESGPYGYHPAAARYDALVCELVQTNRLDGLVEIERGLVEDAKADSWWQMLMLHGATPGWHGTLLSYEAPTYFGMLTAVYVPS